jgi:hypothetical protein
MPVPITRVNLTLSFFSRVVMFFLLAIAGKYYMSILLNNRIKVCIAGDNIKTNMLEVKLCKNIKRPIPKDG